MSEKRAALLAEVETALSALNRIHSGVSETPLSAFPSDRNAIGYIVTQLIRMKEELSGRAALNGERSSGITRTVVEHIDPLHPVSGLCLEIERRYNQLAEKQNVSA